MPRLDRETTLTYLLEPSEIPAAIAWATEHRLEHEWDPEQLSFSLRLEGRGEDGAVEPYLLRGEFDDYRVLPPSWRFLDPRTGDEIGKGAYPLGNWPRGSVLHGNGLICATWSRDAYKERGGPHTDWEDTTQWQVIARQHAQADTIPDMLARLHSEVKRSERRMAPLPAIADQEEAA